MSSWRREGTDVSLWRRLCIWVNDWETYLLGGGGAALGLLPTLAGVPVLPLLIAFAGVATMGAVGKRSERRVVRARLTHRVRDCREVASLSEELHAISSRLTLLAPWRISLFQLDRDAWVLRSREASFEPLRQGGRERIPVGEGCLHWASYFGGEDSMLTLPDPLNEWDKYLEFQSSRNVAAATVESFKMKSRSYAARVCQVHLADGGVMTLGVVVESGQPAGVSAEEINSKLPDEWLGAIARLVALEPPLRRLEGVFSGPLD